MLIHSVHKILDATEQEWNILLCNITPPNDQSIVAEPDTNNCPADLDISNIRQFANLSAWYQWQPQYIRNVC